MGITTWSTIPTLTYIFLTFGAIFGIVAVLLYKRNDNVEIEKIATIQPELFDARKEFVDIFDSVLIKIDSKRQVVSGVLKEGGTMSSHKVAFSKFRSITVRNKSSETVSELDRIWKNYCDTKKYGEGREFVKYNSQKSGTPEGEENAKNLLRNNIQDVIEFVNQL